MTSTRTAENTAGKLPILALILSIVGAVTLMWIPLIAIPAAVVGLVIGAVSLRRGPEHRTLSMAALIIAVVTLVGAILLGVSLIRVSSGIESAPAFRG
ncbi:hypothetical protein [Corynebacterium sphenisci]|uniref:hypothetical protein n=1 Tax=Corynebacterium sphenisci TaxID=191493 RepID=UPI0009515CCF|nr:hypothetical protein [Corynebacterium sphenisci]